MHPSFQFEKVEKKKRKRGENEKKEKEKKMRKTEFDKFGYHQTLLIIALVYLCLRKDLESIKSFSKAVRNNRKHKDRTLFF